MTPQIRPLQHMTANGCISKQCVERHTSLAQKAHQTFRTCTHHIAVSCASLHSALLTASYTVENMIAMQLACIGRPTSIQCKGGVSASRHQAATLLPSHAPRPLHCRPRQPSSVPRAHGASRTSRRQRIAPIWMLVILRGGLERLTCTGKLGDQRARRAMHGSERASKALL